MGTFHSAIGEISGTLGNFVYRRRNGKVIVSARPVRRAPISEGEKARHRIFGTITKVSSAINGNSILKMLWPKKRSYAEICKINFKLTNPALPNYFPKIIPGNGYQVNDANINLSEKGITIATGPLSEDTGIDPKVEKWISAAGVLIFFDKDNNGADKIMAVPITSGKQAIKSDEPINFEINLYGNLCSSYTQCYKTKAIFTIVTLTEESLPIHYSIELKTEN
jgi:hypothetical protein